MLSSSLAHYRRHPLLNRFRSGDFRSRSFRSGDFRLNNSRNFRERKSVSWLKIFLNFREKIRSFSFRSFFSRPSFFAGLAIFLIGFLSLVSLVFTTQEVTKGYVLRGLEANRQSLLREHEVMMMQVARAQALQSIFENRHVASMVEARKIEFVRGDTAMASLDRQ